MRAISAAKCFSLCTLLIIILFFQISYSNVTYDKKALIINGKKKILFSGSIHYPRSTPDMWADLIQKAKDGGLDCIDSYVFWGGHETSPGKYYFEERYDLVRFVKLVQQAGMFMILRIGPYVCAEWNFGGFPVWLKYVPGIAFRTDNEPFKMAMQKFTTKIVQMLKDEKLFQSQGGPIIFSQACVGIVSCEIIENEYGLQSKGYGRAGHAYMNWAAKMAVGLNTGVPWVMCKEDDAPEPVINSCNGFYCDYFSPNKPYKPTIWTEAWTGWFEVFGGPIHHRPVEDLAFAVARFIQKGGSFVNYYMYHGGTNFGRTAGGPFITTSYDYDAPIDEYGLMTSANFEFTCFRQRLLRQHKYMHLKELHIAIKSCGNALTDADPKITSLGNYEQAYVFSTNSGQCAAFLSNFHWDQSATVKFNNRNYHLPPWSISILPDCKNVAFNTATLKSKTSQAQMLPTETQNLSWESLNEDISSYDSDPTFTVNGLLEQLNITRDTTDYLWYMTSFEISPNESCLHGGKWPVLSVASEGDMLHVFINGQPSGSAFGSIDNRKFSFTKSVNLRAGKNSIALLSVANTGHRFETYRHGVDGSVILRGLDNGQMDLSRQKWSYKVGLKGETMNLASPTDVSSSIDWLKGSLAAQNRGALTWYKTNFSTPAGDMPLALDLGSMGKGEVWVNGESIGRYWTNYAKGECNNCSYGGTFRQPKCQDGCGQPTQRWYHVPRYWLKSDDSAQNVLVVFEELGGDASKISLVQRSVTYL
ncbi:beta-galactosidase [Striga asiatica]|uniref:beta-galactosidase n=1 Tax=Striga asiatica TaxID=4170 RepID=A0A5A7P7P5_STRAF|nr:beta-galactosidase [Striga asiatica]